VVLEAARSDAEGRPPAPSHFFTGIHLRPDGEYIRRRRRRIGLDQETFASRAGVDVKTLRRIESNRTQRPQAATIRAIAGVLGCRPEELFGARTRPALDASKLAPVLARCSSCGLQESDPSARFCRRCGQRARDGELGSRKPASVIAVRVQNGVELSRRLDEAAERRLLDAIHESIRAAVTRFEGTLQRDAQGSSAVFGAPLAHEDHAARACRAALWLASQLPVLREQLCVEFGCEPAIGLGVHSGRIVLREGESASGRVVERAAQLAAQGPPGRVQLSESTYRTVCDLFQIEVDASAPGSPSARRYVLERAIPAETRFDAGVVRGLRPFIGRERELEPLHSALDDVSSLGGRVVAVVGDAGLGKSRLCHHFAERARELGCNVHRIVCPSHGRMVPLLPVLALARRLLGIAPDAARDAVQARVSGALAEIPRHEADRALGAKLLLELLDAAEADAAAHEIPPQLRHELLFTFLRELLAARSRAERVVLIVEDAHWMDAASQRFLAGLVAAVRAVGMLVIVNFRPEHLPPWLTSSSVDRIVLRPFEPRECEDLVVSLLGVEAVEPELVVRIAERAGGNPFFAEEIVQMLVDQGLLAGAPGAYKSSGVIGELGVPPRVEDVVAARIDRLAPARRRILQAASVLGVEVPEPLLASVSGTTAEELGVSLRELQWLDLLFEGTRGTERCFHFKHAIVQEVAYQSLLREVRCELHERAFDALVAASNASSEQLDALAHHALGAERWDDAATYFERAAALARKRGAHAAAAAYFERAVAALEHATHGANAVRCAHLRLCWVQALIPLGEAERADAVLTGIRADWVEPEDLARVHLNQVYTFWVQGRYGAALERAETAARHAQGSSTLWLASEFALGRIHYGLGDMRRAARHLETALEGLARLDLEREQLGWPGYPAALIRGFLAHCLGEQGKWDAADAVGRAGLQAAAALDDRYGDVMVRLGAAHACILRGAAREAVELLRPAETACAEVQLRSLACAVAGELAFAHLELGEAVPARARLETVFSETAPRLTLLRVELARAQLAWREGNLEDAELRAVAVREEAESQGDRCTQAYAAWLLGSLEGESSAASALAWLDESCRLADALDLPPLIARCGFARGALHARAGQRQRAALDIERAAQIFTTLGLAAQADIARAALSHGRPRRIRPPLAER
jgi:transcriptional regulator with XRE-family HTH domain